MSTWRLVYAVTSRGSSPSASDFFSEPFSATLVDRASIAYSDNGPRQRGGSRAPLFARTGHAEARSSISELHGAGCHSRWLMAARYLWCRQALHLPNCQWKTWPACRQWCQAKLERLFGLVTTQSAIAVCLNTGIIQDFTVGHLGKKVGCDLPSLPSFSLFPILYPSKIQLKGLWSAKSSFSGL